jgi:hypothetical protein
MMRLYHGSATTEQVGTALVPVFLQDDEQREHVGVYFHEREDIARLWGRDKGFTLYVGDFEPEDLEPHPKWRGVWVSRRPVPFADLDVVDWREGPPGTSGLLERVQKSARQWGTSGKSNQV